MDEILVKAVRDFLTAQQRAELSGAPPFSVADADAFIREETEGKYGWKDAQELLASLDTDVGARNLGRSFVQGATFNLADEALGALGGNKELMRLREEQFARAHPIASGAANIAGAVAVPGVGGGKAVLSGAPRLGAALLKSTAIGAAEGGLAAAGASEGGLDRRTGAAVPGAIAGGAFGFAAPLAGATVRALRPEARAMRRLKAAIDESGGVDAVRVANREMAMSGRGAEATLADLTDPLRGAADFAANADEPTRRALDALSYRRQQDAAGRMLDDTRRLAGTPSAGAVRGDIQAERRAFANSEEGYEGLRNANPQIADVGSVARIAERLNQPVVRAAWKRAQRAGQVGRFPDEGRPSFRQLLDFKIALDGQITSAYRSGDGSLGSRLSEVRDDLLGELELIPQFKTVNARYAMSKRLERALDLGEKWFDIADTRGLAKLLDSYTPDEVRMFRTGMASRFAARLRNTKKNKNLAQELMHLSKTMEEKLRVVFGDPQTFDEFMRGVKADAQLARMRGSQGPLMNSATARRQMAAGADPLDVASDAVMGGPVNAVARAATGLGRGAVARRTASRLGPRLLTQGTQSIDNLLSDPNLFRAMQPFGMLSAGVAPATFTGLLQQMAMDR